MSPNIPDDVMRVASAVTTELFEGTEACRCRHCVSASDEIIARAILAERQRTQTVKPLAWEAYPKDEAIGEPRAHYGFGVGGHYHVTKAGGTWGVGTFTERGQARHVGYFHTRTEAKAAAEADYEQLICSALVPDAILNLPSAASSRAEQTGEATVPPLASSPVTDSDWITWSGGECPVPAGTKIEVKFRNGGIFKDHEPEDWRWSDCHYFFDIIAYRVVTNLTHEEAQ